MHFSPSQMIGDVFVRWGPAFDMLLFFSSRLDSSLKLLKSLQTSKGFCSRVERCFFVVFVVLSFS